MADHSLLKISEQNMDEKVQKWGKRIHGWSDEEIAKLSPEIKKFVSEAYQEFGKYKMIAEVTKSSNCTFNLKEGERLVFAANGLLLPAECTANPCLWAIAPLLPFNLMTYDHLYHGIDPCTFFPNTAKCADTGVGCGGFGEVVFKVFCIESPWTLKQILGEKD